MSYEQVSAASRVFEMGQFVYYRTAGVTAQLKAMEVGGVGFAQCDRIREKSNTQTRIKRTAGRLGLQVTTHRVASGVMFWRTA